MRSAGPPATVPRVAFELVQDTFQQLDGIHAHEIHSALASPRRWPRAAQDPSVGLRVLTIWSRTAEGRPLVIAVRKHSEWKWQCFGARDMKRAELAEFEAWETRDKDGETPQADLVPA